MEPTADKYRSHQRHANSGRVELVVSSTAGSYPLLQARQPNGTAQFSADKIAGWRVGVPLLVAGLSPGRGMTVPFSQRVLVAAWLLLVVVVAIWQCRVGLPVAQKDPQS